MPDVTRLLEDGDTFVRGGYTFKVEIKQDTDIDPPWIHNANIGPGIVSDWVLPSARKENDRLLLSSHGRAIYYNQDAALEVAEEEGWGCKHTPWNANQSGDWNGIHATDVERIRCAVDAEYCRLRAWCDGEWCWMYVTVRLLDSYHKGKWEHLGGIESDDQGHILTVAEELADQIIAGIEVEFPNAILSEN